MQLKKIIFWLLIDVDWTASYYDLITVNTSSRLLTVSYCLWL